MGSFGNPGHHQCGIRAFYSHTEDFRKTEETWLQKNHYLPQGQEPKEPQMVLITAIPYPYYSPQRQKARGCKRMAHLPKDQLPMELHSVLPPHSCDAQNIGGLSLGIRELDSTGKLKE
ncbi:unnamed protein product [Victoria cruziana]